MEPKDSEYYMGNREQLPTIVTLKNSNKVITYELPWDADANDILNAVYSGMVGMTFNPDDVLQAMKDFAEEHLPNEEEKDYENQE